MPRIEVQHIKATQEAQGIFQLATAGAVGTHAQNGAAVFQCDEGIATEQFSGEGIVQAEAFRRVAGTGDDAPIVVMR